MKEKPSKLDAYAERLDGWFGVEKKTLAQVQEELRLDGCSVSVARLGQWWSRRQQQRQEQALLAQIASGARQIREVESSFEKNPAPQYGTLMALFRNFVFQLTTKATMAPELLDLAVALMKQVSEAEKLQVKKEELRLDQERFKRETCELFLKWAEDERAKAIASGASSNTEKIAKLGELMFGGDWN